MDIIELFRMQRDLDDKIFNRCNINRKEVVKDKTLALLVEVGKIAATTRCFTYWKEQSPIEKKEMLANYVDGLHFLLSIGIDLAVDRHFLCNQCVGASKSEVEKFLDVYAKIVRFGQQPSITNYMDMMKNYLRLGEMLKLLPSEIEEGYMQKNQLNKEREKCGA
ncbi:MAG: dUTP diphosphatase [Bacillaceae bacterium]